MSGIIIFLIFLGPLVFFHELGHFFFARLFGVRVETFSIGFGPKLFKWKRGDTIYAFSAIPLGGYVKMFGDDPLSEEKLTEEEKKVAYTHKSKWARFWIVFGGPLANFILAFVIYFALATGGEKVPEPKLGLVTAESYMYEQGVRTGDVVTQINQREISNFDDLNTIDGDIKSIHVTRNLEEKKIVLGLSPTQFQEKLREVLTPLKAPLFRDPKGNQYLLKSANLGYLSTEETLALNEKNFVLVKIKNDFSNMPVFDPGNTSFELDGSLDFSLNEGQSLMQYLRENNYYPAELAVNNVSLNSAAASAQIKKGDIIVGVEGEDVNNFESFKNAVQSLQEGESINISILNNEGLRSQVVTPQAKEINGKKVLLVGIESAVVRYAKMIEFKADGLFAGIQLAFDRTWDGTVTTVGMFKKLVFGEVSVNNLGGPIAIGKAANDYFDMGLSMFFRLMALISINLAVINLFPIPVLDGGHIVFIMIEIFNRGPLSRKKLMLAQQAGMSLLMLLIFVAIFNDIKRFFL